MTRNRQPAQAERPHLKILSMPGRQGFEQVAPLWERLVLRMARARFFHHPDWYRALFDAKLADPDGFIFAPVYDGPDLVALFPLQTGNLSKFGTRISTIGLCDHPHMVMADCIIDDRCECVRPVSSLLDWLLGACPVKWDLLRLEKLPERSPLYRSLSALPPERVMPEKSGASAHLPTENESLALGAVSGSFRRNLRRLAKRAEESAPLSYRVCDTPPALDDAFPRFLEVEASGWKGACGIGTAIAQDQRLVLFYRMLVERFGRQGRCAINLLLHGDRVVAGQFGLLMGGTFSILKIGYCENHSWFAPGNLAMEQTIRWCCAHPEIHEMSFVTSPPWSHFWKPKEEPLVSFRVFSPTIRGQLLRAGLHAKRWHDRWRGSAKKPGGCPDARPRETVRPGAGAGPSDTALSGES